MHGDNAFPSFGSRNPAKFYVRGQASVPVNDLAPTRQAEQCQLQAIRNGDGARLWQHAIDVLGRSVDIAGARVLATIQHVLHCNHLIVHEGWR